jgi:hypothetical protein
VASGFFVLMTRYGVQKRRLSCDPRLPEGTEANHIMADFFVKRLGK